MPTNEVGLRVEDGEAVDAAFGAAEPALEAGRVEDVERMRRRVHVQVHDGDGVDDGGILTRAVRASLPRSDGHRRAAPQTGRQHGSRRHSGSTLPLAPELRTARVVLRWVEGAAEVALRLGTEPQPKASILMGELMDKAKGKIKQGAGEVTNDDQLKGDGIIDELKGHVKGVANEIKSAVKTVVKK